MRKDQSSVGANEERWKESRYIPFEVNAKEDLLADGYNLQKNIKRR